MRKTTLFCAALCLLLLAFAPARAKAVERYEVLMQGDKDQYVFRLQEELHARGYLKMCIRDRNREPGQARGERSVKKRTSPRILGSS